MNSKLIATIILLFFIFVGNENILFAQQSESNFPSVKMGEIRTVKSIVNNTTYELIINLPASYGTDTSITYPVVYFCDGYYDFPLLSMIYNNLNYDKRVTECILVGFSYVGENIDYGPLRMHDYLPTFSAERNMGGGAANYLKVIEDDFIPFVENNYRVDNTWRALGGSSAGGMFTMFALFTNPELFNAYMAISPAAEWDNKWLFKYEKEFYKTHKTLSVSLFMTGAEKEFSHNPGYINSIIELSEVLKNRDYNSFRYQFRLLDDAYHAGSKPEGYTRGMQFIFEPFL